MFSENSPDRSDTAYDPLTLFGVHMAVGVVYFVAIAALSLFVRFLATYLFPQGEVSVVHFVVRLLSDIILLVDVLAFTVFIAKETYAVVADMIRQLRGDRRGPTYRER